MKKFLSMVLCLSIALLSLACGGGGGENPGGDPIPPEQTAHSLEKDYVYMWNQSGVGGADKILKFQTERYALESNARTGAIEKIGAYVSLEENIYGRADFSKLLNVASMKYSLTYGENTLTFNRQEGYHRVIESGKYLQRADYNALVNSSDRNWTGRMEIAATLDWLALNYEVHNGLASEASADLCFTMEFSETLTATEAGTRGLTLRSDNGQGVTVLRSKGDENTRIAFENGVLSVSQDGVLVSSGMFAGFGIIVIPSADAKPEDAEILEAAENVSVTATDRDTGTGVPVTYDARKGIYRVDVSDVGRSITQSTEIGRNTYERVAFQLLNSGTHAARVPLSFVKSGNFSVTGISPVIRDAKTLEPTGIQVQISKNWHTNGNASVPQNDPSRYLEGQWYSGNTAIEVDSGKDVSYEYTCAYGKWGGIYAASHAQLCLIGWGGANNLLWEESALGSWGESVTYDPDIGLGRSMIDDVRPFLVTSEQGGNQQYNWTGNVGGANFLDYYPTAKQSKIIDQLVTYRTQAPNLTDVNYNGVTADGAIAADITINMGRTDDVVRTYYTIKYTFLKDTTPERLSFFKLCADGYADNSFRKYALGDENGATETDVSLNGLSVGYQGEAVTSTGNQFWFGLYDSSEAVENGDVAFVVRDYSAKINGASYEKPSYRIFGTQDSGKLQPSCELTLPAGINTISAGSTVEMLVEYLVLPADAKAYYGDSDYLRMNNFFGTSDAVFDQVDGGRISVSASKGSVTGTYPVTLESESGELAAQFTLTGGLGYVPVRIRGLNSYSGYRLQVKQGSSWTDIVQNGSERNSNDFWQARLDPLTGKYELAFNVKNTVGTSYQTANEYRLIRITQET